MADGESPDGSKGRGHRERASGAAVVVAAVASAVVRWRRAEGVERSQLGWFALAVSLLLVGILLPVPAVGDVLFLVAIPLLPFAVTVAILRRNLYGIEVVVRRSLVYGALTVVLLAAYGAVVALLGTLVQNRTSPAVTLVATGVVAVAMMMPVLPMAASGMPIAAAARHPVLALDRNARGLVLGVEVHMVGIFLGHRRQRSVPIELGVGVGLDPAHDRLQVQPTARDQHGLAGDVRGVTAIEDNGQFERQA